MSTIEDSAIRNTDARARGRGEAFSRAALYARGGDHPARQTPTGVNITLKGCITFENNLPQDTLAFGDGTITDDEVTGPCAMRVGPDPKRPDPAAESDDDDPDPPAPQPSPTPFPSPTPTALPYVCKPTERILVQTGNDDLQCEPVDIITLDKHPDLQGVRFAVRLWRVIPQCVHRVVAADNLYRLAIRYQTTVEAFRSLNGIRGDQLSIGQTLLLPRCVHDGSLAFENTRICFENQMNPVYINTSASPPPVSALETYQINGMTCANVDRPGLVVLTAPDP